MSTNHTYEIIGNDKFNVKILNETLWDIKEMMFNNLYDAQRSISNIKRFDFNMAEHTSCTTKEVIYTANYHFIIADSRIPFRNSRFYKKDLSYSEIVSNPDIFYNTAMVFINGELYTNYYIRPYEDITNIVFKTYDSFPSIARYVRNGFTKTEMQELIDSEATMSIIFIKAHNEYNVNLNRTTLNNYSLGTTPLGYPMSNFASMNRLSHQNTFLTWVSNDDSRLYKYNLVTSETRVDNSNIDKLYLNKDQILTLTNTYTNLKNMYIPDYLESITIPSGTEYFKLPIKDMPIPVENIFIFRKTDNRLLFDHTTTLTLHYPNVYKINTSHNDDIIVYTFYADDTISIGTEYENELALYYKYFGDTIVDKYVDDTIPDIIKNYDHIKMTYDNYDLSSKSIDHLQYKFDKLKSMIYQNGDYYTIYLDKLVGYVPIFYIDVSLITNLQSRCRFNNKQEIPYSSSQVTFSEPCYLFILRHDGNNDKFNIVIDEYQTNDIYEYSDNKYLYVYIPTRLINNDSIIYIEKFVDYKYSTKLININTSNYYQISIPHGQQIRPSDIYVSYKSNENDEIYLTKNDYDIYTIIDGAYSQITINEFYPYPNLYIKFTNGVDNGKTVHLHVNRTTFKMTQKGNATFTINRPINNDKRNILMYRNGRLIPDALRTFNFSDKINGPHTARAYLITHPDDEFTLIYNTNKYYLVYFQELIDSKGVVDLTHKISKPINLKWYDIYLNGLKLDISNIELLGPYVMIIHNVPTIRNLEIYQKNLESLDIDEFIETDDISSKIFNSISDTIKDGLDEIEDTIPDIFEDELDEIVDLLTNVLGETITLINPDINQITQQMLNTYNIVFHSDSKTIYKINPDNNKNNIVSDVFLQPETGDLLLE